MTFRPFVKISFLRAIVSMACLSALAGCSIFHRSGADAIDCSSPLASCHQGRFGLIWKTTNNKGETEGDSISGTYEWRAMQPINHQSPELAYLQVNSTLGPTLGTAKRSGNFYEVSAADGRVYLAQDWQSLFDLIFPVKLPADALIQWMNNPSPNDLPKLPNNWEWQVHNGHYRIRFVEQNTSGRLDLIPQTQQRP